jgi:HsdM N-terminal domain
MAVAHLAAIVAEDEAKLGTRAWMRGQPRQSSRRSKREGKNRPRGMTADHLQGIEKFEADLWKIADNLRANSNLASNEYFMPIMGLIFLRHATNRFYEAEAAIEAIERLRLE